MRRLAIIVVVASFLAGTARGADPAHDANHANDANDSKAEFDYAGWPLTKALEDLRSRGLRLVYGSNTVRPGMMVGSPPEADTLRGVLDELLVSHGLVARESTNGILTVVPAPAGVVLGEVRDIDTSQPIPGAEVEVLALRSVRTNPGGRFEIDQVPPGQHEIEIRKAGYVIERRNVEVAPGARIDIVIRLQPVAETLEEIVVTPGRVSMLLRKPAPEVLWTRDEVDRLPHLSDDLYRAVSRLPGFASGDFSADFHIRGGERNEVLVLIDGLRVYEPFHLKDFQNVFSIFDTNATGAVEVTSGGFTAEYGDRMSGVIEISSVVPSERRTMVGVSFEKLHFLNQGRFASGDGEWLVNARRGYLDLALDAVESEGDDDFDLSPVYYDLFGKVRRRVGENGLLSFNVLAASDDTEFVSDEDDDDFTSAYDSAYAWVKFDTVLSSRSSLASVLSYGRLESERDGESGSNQSDPFLGEDQSLDRTRVFDKRATDIAQFRQDWRFDASSRQHLRFGLEVRRLEADYDYTFVNLVTDPVFTDDEILSERRVDFRRAGWTYGAYFADRFRVGERVTVEAGARWDRQTYADDEQVSPRLNVVVQLRPDTTLRAAFGDHWQSQGIQELQVVDGVEEFYPAQLNRQATLALDRRLGESNRLAIQIYSKNLEDPRPRYENLYEPFDIFPEGQSDRVRIAPERGRSRGLELLFERRRKKVGWWLTYALSEAEDRIDGAWVPRSWDQRHAFSYSINVQPKEHWNLNVAGVHHSGWPATDAELVVQPGEFFPRLVPTERNSDNYPDYHRVDFRASRAFDLERGELKLFLEITNLFDRDNIRSISDFEISFAPEPSFTIEREFEKWFPRLPSFGVTWTF